MREWLPECLIRDNLLIYWEVVVGWGGEVTGEAGEAVVEKMYRVPEVNWMMRWEG